jgi:uncharacterized membrane protein YjgN (DUF898 family)
MMDQGRTLRFRFTGSAAEYFRVWIVGVWLSLLTLGVYSAWAKVRTQQYFYRHTWLDGSSFEYVAQPRALLPGRLLFGAALAASTAAVVLHVGSVVVVLVLFLLATPWVVERSVAFRARSSTYRNVPFTFRVSLGSVYRRFFLSYLGTLLSLGLAYPYARHARVEYVVDGLSYGDANVAFWTRGGQYFSAYAAAGVLLLPTFLLGLAEKKLGGMPGAAARLLGYAWLLVPTVYLRGASANLLYGGMSIGAHRLSSRQRFWPLAGLYASNTLAVLVTLGLATPWAQIRLARYRIEALQLEALGSLDVQARHDPSRPGAYGEAAADLGGVDLGIG